MSPVHSCRLFICLQFTLSLEAVIASEDEATVAAVEGVVQEGGTSESSLAASIANAISERARDEASPLAGLAISDVIVSQAERVEVVEPIPTPTPKSVEISSEAVEGSVEEDTSGSTVTAGVWVGVTIGVAAASGCSMWIVIVWRRRRLARETDGKLQKQYIDDNNSVDDRNAA